MGIKFISQSMMGMFLRCPAQFERRYINGEIIPPGVQARRGSAVHKAAAINHFQKRTSLQDAPLDSLQDAARDEYVRLVKEEGIFIPKEQTSEKEKILNQGLNGAVRLTKLYREALAPQIMPVLVEERLEIDAGLAVPLQGTLDVTTEDGWLPDLKTAAKSKGSAEAETSLQLTFYAGLYQHHLGQWPDRISLEILVDGKESKLQSLPTRRGEEDWANLIVRIQLMLAQVNSGLFPPCDPGAWVCSPAWCGFWHTCKYSLRRRG